MLLTFRETGLFKKRIGECSRPHFDTQNAEKISILLLNDRGNVSGGFVDSPVYRKSALAAIAASAPELFVH